MNHNLQVSESVVINANPAKVWNVLTNPEIIKEYLFGTETVTDWKVGSEIAFQGEYNGHKYRDYGVILENEFHKHLAYSYWSGFSGLEDKPENYSKVIYDLTPTDDTHTTFTWTQKGYPDETRQAHSQSGMKEFLEQIKGIAER
ncbi:MAG TPA: SRPBCC domain-containing protein [Bacteroidia bacterium]|jgi:uncharacterized protein YndB with AHSA1/START domain|nr:SRPBCC domain-containing protein [Bacteroidia bacterium]